MEHIENQTDIHTHNRFEVLNEDDLTLQGKVADNISEADTTGGTQPTETQDHNSSNDNTNKEPTMSGKEIS